MVRMDNPTIIQSIEGTGSTGFENLEIIGSDKILNTPFTEVNGVLSLDAVLKLNSNRITLSSSSPLAINRISGVIDKIVGFLKTICSNRQNSWFLFLPIYCSSID